MNPDAEALIRAYEAYLEDAESETRLEIFEAHLGEVAEKHGIDKMLLKKFIEKQVLIRQRADAKKPPTIPPKA